MAKLELTRDELCMIQQALGLRESVITNVELSNDVEDIASAMEKIRAVRRVRQKAVDAIRKLDAKRKKD